VQTCCRNEGLRVPDDAEMPMVRRAHSPGQSAQDRLAGRNRQNHSCREAGFTGEGGLALLLAPLLPEPQEDHLLIRVELAGHSNGRVYEVTFTADDGVGGRCTGTVVVCVPHDRQADTCVDDGQLYQSL
jgi:hypothetical protein